MRWLAWLVVLGCSGSSPTLRVDVKTDLVAGIEFGVVRAEALGDERTRAALRGESWLEGLNVGTFDADNGVLPLRVDLLLAGEVVMTREVSAKVRGTTAVTVVITRDCRGVSCPGAGDSLQSISCLGGSCVESECVDGTEPDCPDGCTSNAECASGPECAAPRCDEGVCFLVPNDIACGASMRCDPDEGCVPDGEVDAGSDGGVDVGVDDAGIDACVAETCNGDDDDCDGITDEDSDVTCDPGRPTCAGIQRCSAGMLGACEPEPVEVTETCNGLDDDCDGSIDEAPAVCPCPTHVGETSTYLFCPIEVGWDAARTRCQANGYDLVVITSEEENDLVYGSPQRGAFDYWLGLFGTGPRGWEWVSGIPGPPTDPLAYGAWLPGEPDQNRCALMRDGDGGAWDQDGCGGTKEYICESP